MSKIRDRRNVYLKITLEITLVKIIDGKKIRLIGIKA